MYEVGTGVLVTATIMLTAPASASAQSANGIGRYGSLFEPVKPLSVISNHPVTQKVPLSLKAPAESAEKSSVVCGMTMLPGNGALDPRIKHEPPADRQFSIRAVEPTVCHSSSATR
jgi:hypothetical protein